MGGKICPAYAGMILCSGIIQTEFINLSRVCGDDPDCETAAEIAGKFVPRMRG